MPLKKKIPIVEIKEQCSFCKCFLASTSKNPRNECRLEPRKYIVFEDETGQALGVWAYPEQKETDWCSFFKRKLQS